MIREQLDELEIIIRDLRMAIDIKGQVDAGEERGLVSFADGTKISVPIPQEAKGQLADKVNQLAGMLREKAAKIKV